MTRSCKKVRPAPPRLPLLLALVSCAVLAVRSVGMPDVGGYLTDESTPSKRNGAWFTRRSAPSYPDDESALLAMVHEGMSGAEEFLSDDPIHSKRNGAWFTKKSDQTHIGRTSQLMDVVNKACVPLCTDEQQVCADNAHNDIGALVRCNMETKLCAKDCVAGLIQQLYQSAGFTEMHEG